MGYKLCIVTDAWDQVNGVVTTLSNLEKEATADNWKVLIIHPGMFTSFSAPGYPEVKLSIPFGIKKMILDFNPDYLHIATEGPLGLAARLLFKNKIYTTAYHTQWADFLDDLAGMPKTLTWKYIRWFHKNNKTMVPTASIKKELIEQRVGKEIILFSRGVDTSYLKTTVSRTRNIKPRLLSVSRISKEKNLDCFCNLDAKKYNLIVVGDGPYLAELKKKYKNVTFLGALFGSDLANEYAKADVFVFPSMKDTFGIVIIESQCMGTPVAAFPVTGPIDVILPETGAMDLNINVAIEKALLLDRTICKNVAIKSFNWQTVWLEFKNNLELFK